MKAVSRRYLPWIGDRYESLDRRLLLVGESHYEDGRPGAPRKYVRQFINGGDVTSGWQFWRNAMSMVEGKSYRECDRKRFWSDVALVNFVQEPMQSVRHRPTERQWAEASPVFLQTLDELAPTHILVLGSQLWDRLPDTGFRIKQFRHEGEAHEGWIYPAGSGQAVTTYAHHPSRAGWRRWHPLVEALCATRPGAPSVGIFWVHRGEIFGSTTLLVNGTATSVGRVDSDAEHFSSWDVATAAMTRLPDLATLEYSDVPRGRVLFDVEAGCSVVYLDRQLFTAAAQQLVSDFFGLNPEWTRWHPDPHYRTHDRRS